MADADDPPCKRPRLLQAQVKLDDVFNIIDPERVIVKHVGFFEGSSRKGKYTFIK